MTRLCECGCGQHTKLALRTVGSRGVVRGQSLRFIHGHKAGAAPPGKSVNRYQHTGTGEYAHRVRAERALGKSLPPNANVHHVDGSKSLTSALVICQDMAYHKLLHKRTKVVRAGGNPNTQRFCGGCDRPRDFSDFYRDRNRPDGLSTQCAECMLAYSNARNARLTNSGQEMTPSHRTEVP
jgi:hypothetical protein